MKLSFHALQTKRDEASANAVKVHFPDGWISARFDRSQFRNLFNCDLYIFIQQFKFLKGLVSNQTQVKTLPGFFYFEGSDFLKARSNLLEKYVHHIAQ